MFCLLCSFRLGSTLRTTNLRGINVFSANVGENGKTTYSEVNKFSRRRGMAKVAVCFLTIKNEVVFAVRELTVMLLFKSWLVAFAE